MEHNYVTKTNTVIRGKKRRNMIIVVASDVFGNTAALSSFAHAFTENVLIFDPYNSKEMNFRCEKEAYNFFSQNVGLDTYEKKLKTFIQSIKSNVCLIGFSVGASIIWKLSGDKELKNVSAATCFYGSQIRNFASVVPVFPLELVFPKYEEHFSVSDLISKLSGVKNVQISHSSYLHGFMNAHSNNFDEKALKYFTTTLFAQYRDK